MERAKIIRVAGEGEKGEAMAKAIENGLVSVDAKREYQRVLTDCDRLQMQIDRLEREKAYLEQCLGIEADTNRRFRNIYRNALVTEKEKLFAPTRTEKIMAGAFTATVAAIVTLTVMLGYLIIKYCL